ncbi:protein GPR15LG [Sorex araneus]|uniref:protein GPR15LG n=1 Tax=Sorex araneus TaxID=42254 RepID=UPI0001580EC6|nr:protein GPR15LG [Sorex araneus]
MRFQVLCSLLCLLLLCFSVFSVEGRKHPRRPSKSSRISCCPRVAGPVAGTQKGRIMKICRPCKLKPQPRRWVVPGALPQV